PAISAVSGLVMGWATIGGPPPTAALPTFTWGVWCRGLGPAMSLGVIVLGLFMAARLGGFFLTYSNRSVTRAPEPVFRTRGPKRDISNRRDIKSLISLRFRLLP